MGYGLPAAIGAKVAKPDCLVIGTSPRPNRESALTDSDIDGDASFSMTLTELSTAAQFNIGVKIIVLNNEEQGMTCSKFYRYIRKRQYTNSLQVW